jgi:hypothetical protein
MRAALVFAVVLDSIGGTVTGSCGILINMRQSAARVEITKVVCRVVRNPPLNF